MRQDQNGQNTMQGIGTDLPMVFWLVEKTPKGRSAEPGPTTGWW